MRSKLSSVLLLSLAGFFFNCTQQKIEIKQLEDEEMIRLIVDLSTLESALLRTANPVRDSVKGVFLTQLYEVHQLNQEVIDYNLSLLREDLARMDRIYDSVFAKIDRLNENL